MHRGSPGGAEAPPPHLVTCLPTFAPSRRKQITAAATATIITNTTNATNAKQLGLWDVSVDGRLSEAPSAVAAVPAGDLQVSLSFQVQGLGCVLVQGGEPLGCVWSRVANPENPAEAKNRS